MLTNKKPLVSVIIPSYNRSELLSRTINSVLAQTFDNFEIILVDDGSSDNTEMLASLFNDSRICYIRHSKNKGVSAARNTGIKNSKGDFIALLDSDDEYFPEKIEKNLNIFKNASFRIEMVASSYYHKGKGIIKPSVDEKIEIKRLAPLLSTWMIKKKVFEKVGLFDENVFIAEDAEFFWRFRKKSLFFMIREPLVIKNVSINSSHVNKENVIKLRKKTIFSLKKQKKRYLTARFVNMLGKDYRNIGKMKEARRYFLKAFFYYPLNFGYFVNFLKNYKK